MDGSALKVDAHACLPEELRAALGIVLARAGASGESMRAAVIGDPTIVCWFHQLTQVVHSDHQLLAVGAEPTLLLRAIRDRAPARVIILSAGRLAKALAPIRRDPLRVPAAPPRSVLRPLGYTRTRRAAALGPGSICWAAVERLFSRLGRIDIADRCRVARQASLIVSSPFVTAGTLLVDEYERTR
jgi:hypothetical protein